MSVLYGRLASNNNALGGPLAASAGVFEKYNAVVSAAGITTLIQDTFTDADNTLLTAHTISPTNTPSATWATALNSASLKILSNKASQSTSSTDYANVVDSNAANCTISAVISRSGSVYIGIIFRYVDTNSCWLVYADSNASNVQLYKRVGGSYSLVGSQTITFLTNTDYTMTVILNGSSITVTWPGMTNITASDSTYSSATKHGMFFNALTAGSGDNLDNFTVTSP